MALAISNAKLAIRTLPEMYQLHYLEDKSQRISVRDETGLHIHSFMFHG
jgi:hypothetical protein